MLSAVIPARRGESAAPLARRLIHQRSVRSGPLVLGATPLKLPAPMVDRDRTVSRRSEPSSRTALTGEQPDPWDLLQPQDATSRHRGAKPFRRYGLLGRISLLSPAYLLSVERRQFHALPPDHYDLLSHLLDLSVSQSSSLMPLRSTHDFQPCGGTFCAPPLHFRRRPPQSNYPPDAVPAPDYGGRLEAQNTQGGIPRLAPPGLTPWLHSLPPILDNVSQTPTSSCSKGARGLSVQPRVLGIFTETTVSPDPSLRQRPSRYAIRAGRNLPDKEFRYLRTVIVTAAVYRGLASRLRRKANLSA